MQIDPRKTIVATTISAALIAALFWAAEPGALNVARLRPWLAIATVAAFVSVVACRAAALRALAPAHSPGTWSGWFRLAARHQLVFTLAPSGIGDVGFPILARRYAGVGASDAVRIIAQFRFRDVLVLVMLAVIGAIAEGANLYYGLLAFAVGLVALYRADDLAVICLRLVARLLPGGTVAAFLESSISHENIAPRQRAERTALAVTTWLFAATALAFGFAAVGKVLSIGEILLMLAVLNAVGAVAISIAGFGISEAGVTGVLIGMGDSPASAAATALVGRPVLLISMVTACGLLDFGVALYRSSFSFAARH